NLLQRDAARQQPRASAAIVAARARAEALGHRGGRGPANETLAVAHVRILAVSSPARATRSRTKSSGRMKQGCAESTGRRRSRTAASSSTLRVTAILLRTEGSGR